MSKNGLPQWGWSAMEELLQCPVCLDIPTIGIVEQCRHGHHICLQCRKKLESCPLCKCEFLGTRNFILEELIRHYDELKNTMLLNNIVSDVKAITTKKPKKVDSIVDESLASTLHLKTQKRAVHTPNCTKGKYPCRAAECNVVLPLSRLINHVRTFHADIFTEAEVDFRDIYSQSFEILFKNKKPIERNSFIIFVSGIGLLYLNLEIMRSGQLIVFLQMASKFRKCQDYLGSLELVSEHHPYSWNTRLISTRHCFSGMLTAHLCFTLTKNQLKNICVQRKFKCKLSLTRHDFVNTNALTRPNIDQIRIIAGIRASLLSEQSEKKLVRELNSKKNKKPPKITPSTSQVAGRSPNIREIVAQVLETLNIQDAYDGNIDNLTFDSIQLNSTQTQSDNRRKSNNQKKNTRKPNGFQ